MKKIASFTVDHNKLKKGIYISRIDGDVITYDIRVKIPNCGDYISNGAMHTFEHLFATFARNSKYEDSVIYVGPMGCRTGFYLLMRDKVSYGEVIELIKDSFEFVSVFSGKIPGTNKIECGNYLEHDLDGAKSIASDMLPIIKDYTLEMLDYDYER